MEDDKPVVDTLLTSIVRPERRSPSEPFGAVSMAAPVILDLDGKGVQTIARAAGGVRYDLDGDGLADLTSWIGPTEGFLFLDRDGNGTVTNAGEFSFIADLLGAVSDLQGLKAFDSNGDGLLSAADHRWGDFSIWQDKNGNGIAEASEIVSLAAAGVRSLGLAATAYVGTTPADDVITIAKGSYTRTNGATMELLDAALTYISEPRAGLQPLSVVKQSQGRKASKYRISAIDGRMVVKPKHGDKSIDGRAGGLTGFVELNFKNRTVGMLTSIVLDLDGDGVSLVKSSKSHGWFDMNGDGSPDRQGWAGRRDGFLVIDRDGDGRIANGAELNLLAEDPSAGSSLAALAKLDSNGDKVIDSRDARFSELKVWVDANGNGTTDDGELRTLTDLAIASISLDARATGDKVKPGENLLMATTTFTYANGMKRTAGDVALAYRPSEPPPADTSSAPIPAIPPASTTSGPEASDAGSLGSASATRGSTGVSDPASSARLVGQRTMTADPYPSTSFTWSEADQHPFGLDDSHARLDTGKPEVAVSSDPLSANSAAQLASAAALFDRFQGVSEFEGASRVLDPQGHDTAAFAAFRPSRW